MTRQAANFLILDKLRELIKQYPDWRFGQILYNSALYRRNIDPFYEESTDMLERCFPASITREEMIEELKHLYEFRATFIDGFHVAEIINLKSADDYKRFSSTSEERTSAFLSRWIQQLYRQYKISSNTNVDIDQAPISE